MPELDIPQKYRIDIILKSDPLDYMTFDELLDLRERINKAMLRKAIKESIEKKKAEKSMSDF